MRSTLFLALSFVILGVFLWLTLSGALLFFTLLILLGILLISIVYPDTIVLYLLGAREIGANDQKEFFEATSQEAYKLAVPMPKLYFYNGIMERAFILQNRHALSVVISKSLLDKCSFEELSGIVFELLLQVKKGMAPKRTRSMYLLGVMTWFIHSVASLILKFIPIKEVKEAMAWFINYFLHPLLNFLFRFILGTSYFKKLKTQLSDFPIEKDRLDKAGLKLVRAANYTSIPSRKLFELFSSHKSRHFQRIIAFEFLPHEWDYFFTQEELLSAK